MSLKEHLYFSTRLHRFYSPEAERLGEMKARLCMLSRKSLANWLLIWLLGCLKLLALIQVPRSVRNNFYELDTVLKITRIII